ncbi:ABC transporter permease [Umezawaea endophytica]|uniref:ABC transporter permease n=1 Tax=Umezawaea endophytica TaxID=1654476 RepID=A0A9X2VXL0_9PSEU|nr:ABC transporter permease [Umezawaea endophytica]MCS7484549.1 ABC transporter permease [Umezawaea endophytica]
MIDVVASEWLKVRTVRSTYYLLLTAVLALAFGGVVSYLMTADYDQSPPELRAAFASADPSVFVMPFTQFAAGVIGALAITSEYTGGMIRTVLVTVPRRVTLLVAKIAVVGGSALALGGVVSFLSYGVGVVIIGDRPAPLAQFATFGDALPSVLANGLSIAVVALVGLGFGMLLRSTAGALTTLCFLMFVVPMVAVFLPAPWNNRLVSVTLLYLTPQFSGSIERAPLTPGWALAVLLAYPVVALVAGAVALVRRDA